MKNFLLILALALAVIGAIVSFVGIQKVEKVETTSLDSAAIVKLLKSQTNPSFTSVEQILAYRQDLNKESFIDSVLATMPVETLTDVATVVINKRGSTTQGDIVEEFRQNRQVYTHLHPTATENPANTTPPDQAIQDSINAVLQYVGTTSINYKDTVIDGKPVKQKIVTHVTYE